MVSAARRALTAADGLATMDRQSGRRSAPDRRNGDIAVVLARQMRRTLDTPVLRPRDSRAARMSANSAPRHKMLLVHDRRAVYARKLSALAARVDHARIASCVCPSGPALARRWVRSDGRGWALAIGPDSPPPAATLFRSRIRRWSRRKENVHARLPRCGRDAAATTRRAIGPSESPEGRC